jgi:hypothetical protein
MDWLLTSLDVLFDFPRWYIGAILGTGFFTYYLREAVKVCLLNTKIFACVTLNFYSFNTCNGIAD